MFLLNEYPYIECNLFKLPLCLFNPLNYSLILFSRLVEQHENLLLDLTSSSSENEEFGDENEQAVYETVTDLVDRVALKINVGKVALLYIKHIPIFYM